MTPGTRVYTVVKARALTGTIKALQVDIGTWETPVWIPRTQIAARSKVRNAGDVGTLVVSEWIAKQVGWIR
jgi:hypothetical protein